MTTDVIINDILPYTQIQASMSGQTVFSTNWTANYPSDVVVYYTPMGDVPDDATQILSYPSQYSVAFIGDQAEVQVTLVTGVNIGDIITITRQTPADRENLYTNTNFTPSMLNNDFGILTLVDQQAQLVNQQVGPRYNYSATTTTGVDNILPVLTESQTWAKNSNNTAIVGITLGSVATLAATNPNYPYVSSAEGSFTPGHIVVAADALGSLVDGGEFPGQVALTIDADSGSATSFEGAITVSGGSSGLTTSGASTTVNITGTLNVAHGGTGDTSFTSYMPIIGGATSTGNLQSVSNSGANAGYVLTYVSSSAAPTFQSSSLTVNGDSGSATSSNNAITISGGTTGLTTSGSSSTLNFAGTLNVGHGGTGANTFTAYMPIIGGSTSAGTLQSVSTAGVNPGYVLTYVSSSAAPTFQLSPTGSGTVDLGSANQLGYYASSGTVISGLTSANNSSLTTNGSGAPAWNTNTGTGNSVLAISPTLITPTLGAASAISVSFSSTSGIIGTTTNDSAATGSVGEFVSSQILSASSISLTSITAANVTSISLTAGDWDVWGNIAVTLTGNSVAIVGCLNTTSATIQDFSMNSEIQNASNLNTGFFATPVPQMRISIASTTTVYLVAYVNFSSGTAKACGGIYARRVR